MFAPRPCPNEDIPTIGRKIQIMEAIERNDVDLLKEHLNMPDLYNMTNQVGYNLLQISIFAQRYEVFDYLLSIPGFPLEIENIYGETALMIALGDYVNRESDDDEDSLPPENYSHELLKKGACTDVSFSKGNSALHCAIKNSYVHVAKLLIEQGVDVNVCNDNGRTPLEYAFRHQCDDEVITALLMYGVIPSIDAFENGILRSVCPQHQLLEYVFLNIFDEHSDEEISLNAIVKLAIIESPLFYDLLKYRLKVYIRDRYGEQIRTCFKNLCSMRPCYLKIITDKFGYHVRQVVNLMISNFLNIDWKIENLSLMLESELKPDVIELLSNIHSESLRWSIPTKNESTMTEIYCFYVSYGLNINERDLEKVYSTYGHHDLFEILLHMDIQRDPYHLNYTRLAVLFYDMSFDFEREFKVPSRFAFRRWHTGEMMTHFVLPGLRETHLKCAGGSNENLPQLPLLLELARNAFRKHFIKTFQIKTSRGFYTLLKRFPISGVHKKMITYETNLYKKVW